MRQHLVLGRNRRAHSRQRALSRVHRQVAGLAADVDRHHRSGIAGDGAVAVKHDAPARVAGDAEQWLGIGRPELEHRLLVLHRLDPLADRGLRIVGDRRLDRSHDIIGAAVVGRHRLRRLAVGAGGEDGQSGERERRTEEAHERSPLHPRTQGRGELLCLRR